MRTRMRIRMRTRMRTRMRKSKWGRLPKRRRRGWRGSATQRRLAGRRRDELGLADAEEGARRRRELDELDDAAVEGALLRGGRGGDGENALGVPVQFRQSLGGGRTTMPRCRYPPGPGPKYQNTKYLY